MRLRCDSDPAGAATPQIAPPTRAPAGRGPTDARHSRHARSHSHHGHREATVTPQSLQAAGKLLCATTLSSLDAAVVTRRRRRVTSFAFPSGGAPIGASRHLRLALCDDAARAAYAECIYGSECEDCVPHAGRDAPPMAICIKDCMIGMPSYASDGDCDGGGPVAQELVTGCAECGPRFPVPASSAPMCAETPRTTQGVSQVVQLGFRRRLRRRRPRLADRMCVYMGPVSCVHIDVCHMPVESLQRTEVSKRKRFSTRKDMNLEVTKG